MVGARGWPLGAKATGKPFAKIRFKDIEEGHVGVTAFPEQLQDNLAEGTVVSIATRFA